MTFDFYARPYLNSFKQKLGKIMHEKTHENIRPLDSRILRNFSIFVVNGIVFWLTYGTKYSLDYILA